MREYSFNKSHSYIASNCLNRFRWVFCQLDALKKCLKPGSIRKALQNLPKTLDDTYARILVNINEECQQEARRALLWLAFSERPLLLEEVAEVAVFDPDIDFDPNERLPDPGYVLEILGSLVTVSSNSASSDDSRDESDDDSNCLPGREIRLAHFLVKEYLISERIRCGKASEFGATNIEANHFIAKSCLLYTFHYDDSDSKTMSPKDLECFPLLQYACQFWYTHAKSLPVESQKSLNPIIFRLFLSDTTLVTWLRVHRPDDSIYKPFGVSNDIWSPLYYASDIGLEAIVQILLEAKADVNTKTNDGKTALHQAARNGHEAVVKLLLEATADVNAKISYGWTALHLAARNGHEAVVQQLLEAGAGVNARDSNGWTVLPLAAGNGHEALVKLLLKAKADVNARNSNGWTALHLAASNGHLAVVKLLLKATADVNAKSSYGWTALDVAAENGHEAVVRLLLEAKADVNAKDSDKWTALHRAAENGHEVVVVRLLLEAKADVYTKTSDGSTALDWAAEKGYEAVVKLLEAKPDVNTRLVMNR